MKGFREGLHRGLEETDKAGSETLRPEFLTIWEHSGTIKGITCLRSARLRRMLLAKKKTGWRAGRTTAAAAEGA